MTTYEYIVRKREEEECRSSEKDLKHETSTSKPIKANQVAPNNTSAHGYSSPAGDLEEPKFVVTSEACSMDEERKYSRTRRHERSAALSTPPAVHVHIGSDGPTSNGSVASRATDAVLPTAPVHSTHHTHQHHQHHHHQHQQLSSHQIAVEASSDVATRPLSASAAGCPASRTVDRDIVISSSAVDDGPSLRRSRSAETAGRVEADVQADVASPRVQSASHVVVDVEAGGADTGGAPDAVRRRRRKKGRKKKSSLTGSEKHHHHHHHQQHHQQQQQQQQQQDFSSQEL